MTSTDPLQRRLTVRRRRLAALFVAVVATATAGACSTDDADEGERDVSIVDPSGSSSSQAESETDEEVDTDESTQPPPSGDDPAAADPCDEAVIRADLDASGQWHGGAVVVGGACVDGWALVDLDPGGLGDTWALLQHQDGWSLHVGFPTSTCREDLLARGVPEGVLSEVTVVSCEPEPPPSGSGPAAVTWTCDDLAVDAQRFGDALEAAYGDFDTFADAPGFAEEVPPWIATFSAACGADWVIDTVNEAGIVDTTYRALLSML